ncbi:ArnT family glycosyltransferase [Methylophaga thalassica]|uniref:ArnT family glycosyltransferase n=1 Tax=Methylophaga aminisulfidivorans TaxID=230105 RepID=UPI003A912B5F
MKQDTLLTKRLVYILILAAILRILWMLWIPVVPVSDSVMYHEFAKSISEGKGYAYPAGNLTAYWPVGTPAIYGSLYALFGQHYEVIAIFNVFVGILTTLFIILLAQQWFSARTAAIAGLIYALWPSQIQYTTILASELLFNLFMIIGLFCWYRFQNKPVLSVLTATLFFVCAAYVRPIALLLPFILLALHFLNHADWKRLFTSSMLVAITMAVLISPWAVRNYHLFGKPVLISTNGGPVLWMGNNPASSGEYMPLPDIHFDSEVERANYFKEKALEHIKQEPMLFLKRAGKRFVDYFRSENIGVNWNIEGIKQKGAESLVLPMKLLSTIYWLSLVGLSVYAIGNLIKKNGFWQASISTPIFALLAYFVVLHVIIASGDRYHFPIIPLIALLSATSIKATYEKLKERKQT